MCSTYTAAVVGAGSWGKLSMLAVWHSAQHRVPAFASGNLLRRLEQPTRLQSSR